MIFLKILTLFASIGICILFIKKRESLVRFFGKTEYAERYLGAGGSYNMWILIGLLIVIFAAIWLVGIPISN